MSLGISFIGLSGGIRRCEIYRQTGTDKINRLVVRLTGDDNLSVLFECDPDAKVTLEGHEVSNLTLHALAAFSHAMGPKS